MDPEMWVQDWLDGLNDGLIEADYPADLIEPMGRASVAYRRGWSAAATAVDRARQVTRARRGQDRAQRSPTWWTWR